MTFVAVQPALPSIKALQFLITLFQALATVSKGCVQHDPV